MSFLKKIDIRGLMAVAILLIAVPAVAFAQTDEIQVYDASIAAPGIFNLTWHNNYIPSGGKSPAFIGGLVPNHAFNGVTEWAYGVTPWLEAGLYFPLYSISQGRGATFNGAKLRLLFVSPHAADRTFFYGANFEFSFNSGHWDPRPYTSEIRPIVGWHLHPFDIIINPILDNSWLGGVKSLDFAPESRLAYNFNPKWAIAAEEYDDIGPLRQFLATADQAHQLYGVVDHGARFADVEFGVGFGLTPASDKLTLKLILSRDLNSHPDR